MTRLSSKRPLQQYDSAPSKSTDINIINQHDDRTRRRSKSRNGFFLVIRSAVEALVSSMKLRSVLLMVTGILCIAIYLYVFHFYNVQTEIVEDLSYLRPLYDAATDNNKNDFDKNSAVSSSSPWSPKGNANDLTYQMSTEDTAVGLQLGGSIGLVTNNNTGSIVQENTKGQNTKNTTAASAATGTAAEMTHLSLSFDTCRNITWNEITIHLSHEQQMIILSNQNNDNVSLERDNRKYRDTGSEIPSTPATTTPVEENGNNNNVLVLQQDIFQSQTDAIMAQVTPYFQLMQSQNPHNRTVLILPKALYIYSKLVQDDDHQNDITMVTHMGIGKYNRFLVLVQRWNGPISVAIMIHSLEDLEQFHTFVSLHLVTLKNVLFHYYIEYAPELVTAYPQNILRNLAYKHIETEYFIVNDVDIFPSPNNSHDIMKAKIISQHPEIRDKLQNDTFFVIPMFDLGIIINDDELTHDHVYFPNTKKDAIAMIQNGTLYQHGGKSHPRGHGAVNYTKWLENPIQEEEVSYPIQYDFFFEPYVLGSRSIQHNNGIIPSYFEMYRGFGFDKFSWYSELEIAGFKLEVLRDFFMFHAKHEVSYGDKGSDRDKHFRTNRACSRIFLEEIVKKYGPQNRTLLWKEWLSFCRLKW